MTFFDFNFFDFFFTGKGGGPLRVGEGGPLRVGEGASLTRRGGGGGSLTKIPGPPLFPYSCGFEPILRFTGTGGPPLPVKKKSKKLKSKKVKIGQN